MWWLDNSMLLCFKLLVPGVSYLWPYRLWSSGFTFHTDINTHRSPYLSLSPDQPPPAQWPALYHPTQLSIHYVFCRAKSYFVGSLDWLAWQDRRRKQPSLLLVVADRGVVAGGG